MVFFMRLKDGVEAGVCLFGCSYFAMPVDTSGMPVPQQAWRLDWRKPSKDGSTTWDDLVMQTVIRRTDQQAAWRSDSRECCDLASGIRKRKAAADARRTGLLVRPPRLIATAPASPFGPMRLAALEVPALDAGSNYSVACSGCPDRASSSELEDTSRRHAHTKASPSLVSITVSSVSVAYLMRLSRSP